jgi:CheY-like chemotaxis protein
MDTTSNKKVLLIDDEDFIGQVVKSCIELFSNWQITTTKSGEEGLISVATDRPDVILLDMLMPTMDGFAFLKKLQADPQLADIPVVLLTSRVDLTESRKIAQLGVQGAIAKPFHPTRIVSQLVQILGW